MRRVAGPQERVVRLDPLIKQVKIDGNTRLESRHFAAPLRRETRWVPLSPDYPFDAALLEADINRITEVYASNGFYDARVVKTDVFEIEPGEIAISISIDEGDPTQIQTVSYTWSSQTEDEGVVEQTSNLTIGEPFVVAKMNAAQGAIKQSLLNLGHPLAEVIASAEVDRASREAHLTFDISPRPLARVRTIKIVGLEKVPEYMVQREIEFAYGELVTPGLIQQIESAIKAMRVFSWVSFRHNNQISSEGEMDVEVLISESDPHRVKIGTAIGIDTYRWQQILRLDYTNTNVFGHLTRLDMRIDGGIAQLPNPLDPTLIGPVVRFRPKFTKKGLLENQLLWTLTPEFKLDLRDGYQFWEVSNSFGPSRWFWNCLLLGVYQQLTYDNFFNISPLFTATDSILGRDFRDPYLLVGFHVRAQLYLTDSIRSPKNGPIFETFYTIASSAIGSDYDFHRWYVSAREYIQLGDRFQIASRARTGIIVPFGNKPGVPFHQLYQLGGPTSVRGWGSRRLSPRIEDCDGDGNCTEIPVGGSTFIQGNLELRYKIFSPLRLVAFFDMGDVQRDEFTWVPQEWNYSAGPALRLKTPLGTIRLDVGFRLNDPGVYTEEPFWAAYVGMGDTI